MVSTCCVTGCKNRSKAGSGISFFRVPKLLEKRTAWILAINRKVKGSSSKLWEPSVYSRVCSEHFETGLPHDDEEHVDYKPTKNMGYGIGNKVVKKSSNKRAERRAKRNLVEEMQGNCGESEAAAVALLELSAIHKDEDKLKGNSGVEEKLQEQDESTGKSQDKATQTSSDVSMAINVMKAKLRTLELELSFLQKQKQLAVNRVKDWQKTNSALKFTFENIKQDIEFFTGVSLDSFNFLASCFQKSPTIKLTIEDSLLLTLMKLRLACPNKDLSIRFKVTMLIVKNVFDTMLDNLAYFLRDLIAWPEQAVNEENLPPAFRPKFEKVISIIDCFELIIDRPAKLTTRAQCWSTYKHAHTVKYLISITPSGAISFLSDGWGGSTSDRQIALESQYLTNLKHGDRVLADSGFTIQQELAACGAGLLIPDLKRGKDRTSLEDVATHREMARLRKNVQRVIDRLRKFRVLTSNCPLTLVKSLDKIVLVLAAIINMQKLAVNDKDGTTS